MNGRLGPEQKADHGSMGGTNELSLGNGSPKEKEVWGRIEAHLGPEWEEEQLKSSFPQCTCAFTIGRQQQQQQQQQRGVKGRGSPADGMFPW